MRTGNANGPAGAARRPACRGSHPSGVSTRTGFGRRRPPQEQRGRRIVAEIQGHSDTAVADYHSVTEGDQFIPIREIGAPWNLYNSVSNIDEALTDARPDRYKGVVLTGGVHMDSMRGGNPLIQFAAYVVAGFPQPQNPPAVDTLTAQWFDEWFAGDTGVGDDLLPGSTIDIPTPQGTAHGVVIGTPPAAATALLGPVTFEPAAPTTIPQVHATLASLVG